MEVVTMLDERIIQTNGKFLVNYDIFLHMLFIHFYEVNISYMILNY